MLIRRIMLCSTLIVCGCTPATSAGAKDAKAAAPAEKPAATAEKAPAEKAAPPVPEKKVAPPKTQQLVANGRFETWTGDLPEGWIGDKASLAKSSDVTSGENAVELKASESDYTLLEQAVANVPKGKKLLVSAKIKAEGPEDVALKALYFQGGEDKSQRVQYKGAGDWKVTSFEMELPQDATASSFRVQILRGPKAEGKVLVDDVAVIVEPTAASTAAPAPAPAAAPAEKEPAAEKAPAKQEEKAAPAAKADAPAKSEKTEKSEKAATTKK